MMKTIAMITVHRTLNYGTMLQMYACSELFRERGCQTGVVDYYRPNDFKPEDYRSAAAYCKKRLAVEGAGGLKSKALTGAKGVLLYKDTKRFSDICSRFMKEKLSLTKPYLSYEALRNDPPPADLYVAGSDQIWNSDYNGKIDPAFFLGFAKDGAEKIAYASSIGKEALSEAEGKDFQRYLSDFSAVSVREQSAADILNGLGIEAQAVLDPTLTVNTEKWEKLCSEPVISGPYLLIYKLKGDDTLDRIAYRIAEEKKLPIVRISFSGMKKQKGETTVVLPEIGEFLSLIKGAAYVVTNSFHGTCFSINFNRQFTAVTRQKYNTRIANILKALQIEDRLCTSCDDISAQPADIDYTSVDPILQGKRDESLRWLDRALLS